MLKVAMHPCIYFCHTRSSCLRVLRCVDDYSSDCCVLEANLHVAQFLLKSKSTFLYYKKVETKILGINNVEDYKCAKSLMVFYTFPLQKKMNV